MDWHRLSFYEIYPTSFYDSNADGIGDIPGIIQKLDYVASLGVKGIWFNPFFLSPFRDGGYDIVDYQTIDPKFGTNADAYRLIKECHKRNLLVVFDLVAGHMSYDSPLFLESAKATPNPAYDRFIWTDNPWVSYNGFRFIRGLYPRSGAAMVNFFVHQPALNYGFGNRPEPWMDSVDDKGPKANRGFMEDVMSFWCSHGVDGFRCDMAGSIVKLDTPDAKYTKAFWNEVFDKVREKYPNLLTISEWSDPAKALTCFDLDFVLDWPTAFPSLLMRNKKLPGRDEKNETHELPAPLLRQFDYVVWDSFVKDLTARVNAAKALHKGLSLISGNHDTARLAEYLNAYELRLAYVFLLTMPGVPFLYYGDEVGQPNVLGLQSKDGGFSRTGARTPIRWNDGANGGFSKADSDKLYLPENPKALSVADSEANPLSLLNEIKALLALRDSDPDLTSDDFELIPDQPLCYRRGKTVVAIALREDPVTVDVKPGKAIYAIGKYRLVDHKLSVPFHSAVVYQED